MKRKLPWFLPLTHEDHHLSLEQHHGVIGELALGEQHLAHRYGTHATDRPQQLELRLRQLWEEGRVVAIEQESHHTTIPARSSS